MDIIGHRGSSYDAPENTLASVELAWEEGTDAVEIDVHLSADRRVMVMHDASTARTTDGDFRISQTPSEQLRKLDAGSHKGPQWAGQKIPFLEEVIATIPAGRTLFVEIKCGADILPVMQGVLDASGKRPQIRVISFALEVVFESKRLMPDVPAYWLRGTAKDEAGKPRPHSPELVQTALAYGLDGLDLSYDALGSDVVEASKAAGLAVYAWTVNDPAQAAHLRDLGVDGVATDRPGWMIRKLRAYAESGGRS